MVGIGFLMIAVAWWCGVTLLRKRELSKLQIITLMTMSFAGWVATLAGWYVTEIGRQPYLVSGVLKTADAVTNIASGNVLLTFVLYMTMYVVLLVVYVRTLFLMAKKAVEIEEYDLSPPGLPEGPKATNTHLREA
jgi:cytochrome d ubiquinol oxidase subunit I